MYLSAESILESLERGDVERVREQLYLVAIELRALAHVHTVHAREGMASLCRLNAHRIDGQP